MTDYELMSLFGEYVGQQQVVYMNFVTIIFAYIIASYLVADKLSGPMAAIITILFTVVAFQMGTTSFFLLQDQFGLVPEMATRSALQFHGAVQGGQTLINMYTILNIITQIIAYVGALIFFFHQRRIGLQAQERSTS